jgi:hypothetical protein
MFDLSGFTEAQQAPYIVLIVLNRLAVKLNVVDDRIERLVKIRVLGEFVDSPGNLSSFSKQRPPAEGQDVVSVIFNAGPQALCGKTAMSTEQNFFFCHSVVLVRFQLRIKENVRTFASRTNASEEIE